MPDHLGWIGVEAHKKSDSGVRRSALALGLWLKVWLRSCFWTAVLFGGAVLLFVVLGAVGPDDEGGGWQQAAALPPGPSLPEGGPVPPVSPANESTPIYVVLSAFQDGERCARTLGFALQKAKHPRRVHFRVMQALDPEEDLSCASIFASEWLLDNICESVPDCEEILARTRFWTIPLEQGMGPAHQRGLENENLDFGTPDTFCMTIDAHMDFRTNWDVLMINDWLKAENEFAVLTTYPAAMSPHQEAGGSSRHVAICGYYLEDGIPRGKTGATLPTTPGARPSLTTNWAAGLAFHRCHADRNVPVDAQLRWMFTGEEINRAVRLWTHGYDLYLPSEVNVFHDYSQAKQAFWRYSPLNRVEEERNSKRRLWSLLGITAQPGTPSVELGAFGVGTQRSLEQYVEWSTIDLGTPRWAEFLAKKGLTAMEGKTPHSPYEFCQKLKRVPVRDVQALRASIYRGGPPPPSSTLEPLSRNEYWHPEG